MTINQEFFKDANFNAVDLLASTALTGVSMYKFSSMTPTQVSNWVVVPAGVYILCQVLDLDSNSFALRASSSVLISSLVGFTAKTFIDHRNRVQAEREREVLLAGIHEGNDVEIEVPDESFQGHTDKTISYSFGF